VTSRRSAERQWPSRTPLMDFSTTSAPPTVEAGRLLVVPGAPAMLCSSRPAAVKQSGQHACGGAGRNPLGHWRVYGVPVAGWCRSRISSPDKGGRPAACPGVHTAAAAKPAQQTAIPKQPRPNPPRSTSRNHAAAQPLPPPPPSNHSRATTARRWRPALNWRTYGPIQVDSTTWAAPGRAARFRVRAPITRAAAVFWR